MILYGVYIFIILLGVTPLLEQSPLLSSPLKLRKQRAGILVDQYKKWCFIKFCDDSILFKSYNLFNMSYELPPWCIKRFIESHSVQNLKIPKWWLAFLLYPIHHRIIFFYDDKHVLKLIFLLKKSVKCITKMA